MRHLLTDPGNKFAQFATLLIFQIAETTSELALNNAETSMLLTPLWCSTADTDKDTQAIARNGHCAVRINHINTYFLHDAVESSRFRWDQCKVLLN